MHAVLVPFLAAPAAFAHDLGSAGVTTDDLPDTFSSSADTTNTRSLLHGSLKPWQYPTCPRCKLIRCSNGWWTGHCKKEGSQFTCRRSKTSVARLAAPPDGAVLEVPKEDVVGDVDSILIDGEAPAPYVPCASSGECLLPAKEFARVNGSAPIQSKGKLKARCVFPEKSAAARFGSRSGVCVCTYKVAVPSTEEEVTAKPRKKESRVRVDDFCVRKARPVIGPRDRNTGRYRHAPHAEIGPRDVLAPPTAGKDTAPDGPDLTGVTVSNSAVGEELEVFDAEDEEPVPEVKPKPTT